MNIKRELCCLISFSSFFCEASDVPVVHPVCTPVNSGIIGFFGDPACGIDETVFVVVGKAVVADDVKMCIRDSRLHLALRAKAGPAGVERGPDRRMGVIAPCRKPSAYL